MKAFKINQAINEESMSEYGQEVLDHKILTAKLKALHEPPLEKAVRKRNENKSKRVAAWVDKKLGPLIRQSARLKEKYEKNEAIKEKKKDTWKKKKREQKANSKPDAFTMMTEGQK